MRSSHWYLRGVLAAFALTAASGCASRGGPRAADGSLEPTPADLVLQCARSVVQAGGFHVRLRDPREPFTLIADGGATSASTDVIVVRVVPSSSTQERPLVSAVAQTAQRGALASAESRDTARRVESRCGGNPFDR
jgi:hypothetical protein